MAPIVKKAVVAAAKDGILISPATHGAQNQTASILIPYSQKEAELISVPSPKDSRRDVYLESYGIVGLLSTTSGTFLVSILSRKQVAQINGKSVYVVTGIALIALASPAEAGQTIEQAKLTLKSKAATSKGSALNGDSSDEDDGNRGYLSTDEVEDDQIVNTPLQEKKDPLHGSSKHDSSIAQDVIGKKGQYGRFAERWFSRRLAVGTGNDSGDPRSPSVGVSNLPTPGDGARDQEGRRISSSKGNQPNEALIPKLLRTTKTLLNSQSFYFSYDMDITRRLGNQQRSLSPDPLYFWNRYLATIFIKNAVHQSFIVPLMQGFVGQRAFSISKGSENSILNVKHDIEELIELQDNASNTPQSFKASAKTRDFIMTLISRRSINRPGLRYLRRGVDDEGSVANFVETEQILSSPSWASSERVFSFTQCRGSIPLFFSQSPYSFKPTPVLQHSFEINHIAFKKHFTDIVKRYGNAQIALLVDQHGPEAKIGEEYEKHVAHLNENGGINGIKIGFQWFDFHKECRGMHFENVLKLMDSLEAPLKHFGTFEGLDGKVIHSQTGILRTNCMDCLDRTNVVQTACGQRALEQQLSVEGMTVNLQNDESTQWFNFLWAENGDSISKQYASTAALKGDYTRTRKRDYRGAINDFGLTLTRYYNNIINDWFSQAVIDFLLGNVTDEVFEEFEANMMSGDPGTSMSRVRERAVDSSFKIVVEDQTEELYGGWAILKGFEASSLRRLPLEEIILLVTNAALYAVRFDWNMEKVSAFERVDLSSIIGVYRGTYITNTFTASQIDPKRNQGLVVQYRPGKESITRVNTRSLSTAATPRRAAFHDETPEANKTLDMNELAQKVKESKIRGKSKERETKETDDIRILAFKALPARSSFSTKGSPMSEGSMTEDGLVTQICDELARLLGEDPKEWVKEKDIISLAEARKSTGLFEQWGHSLKKFLWA